MATSTASPPRPASIGQSSLGSSPVTLAATVAKVQARLLPFLLLMYVLAFLDRANIGFAKKAFQLDTGIGDAAFALGAGIFFIGYALFEVPSNLIMHRVGARIWMCRIMVTWGVISAGMAFAHDETTFYGLRFLLGVAEAGFFPGVILYMTYWFPSQARARVMGMFYFGAPIAFILGSPLSGLLLDLHGAGGLLGWQWMFLVEGLLASAVGVWAYWYLNNRPTDATWLSTEEKSVLAAAVDAEEAHKHAHGPKSVLAALANPRLLYLCAIYFLIQMSVYGVVFYLPTQVAGLLGKKVGFEVGLVTAIPWICALAAAYLIPRHSDRTGERRVLAALTLSAAGLGIAVSAGAGSPLLALLALCVAAAGFIAVQPLFWTFPTGYLGGVAAAGGIAMVNSLGALGGFVAPNVKTWAEGFFASTAAGLYLLAATTLLGALLILGLKALGLVETQRSDGLAPGVGLPQHQS
ncbi:MFS transporter [Azospirillum cavernae]|uniref:MFS transporter n=1 Tax=Azospirillum cavernae TaxID=2320860 RepID=A0A418VZZ4_9PROT|nr:MFS transporter [Azospirillum cavernae]RJF83346.1 MFS transporter [Azospirillum cavernae]